MSDDDDGDVDFEGRAIEVFLIDIEDRCCGVELGLDAETGTLVGDMVLSVLPKPPLLRVVDVRVDETLIVEGGDGRRSRCFQRKGSNRKTTKTNERNEGRSRKI